MIWAMLAMLGTTHKSLAKDGLDSLEVGLQDDFTKLVFKGVSVFELMNRAGIQAAAKFVVITGYDWGWTTNLPLADFLAEDALFVDLHDGEPLSADHGGPVRLVVPRLYAWKSAKWVRRVDLVAEDLPGYWERAGYHNHGDPWTENSQNPDGERFG